jgi:hypothetical protein
MNADDPSKGIFKKRLSMMKERRISYRNPSIMLKNRMERKKCESQKILMT